MNDEQLKKMIEDTYDDSREDAYRSMARDFFSRKMRTVAIIVFAHFLFFLGLGILSGILFFKTDQTRYQIMYAAFFVCCILISYLIKVFGWVMGSKNSIQREVKRLELRIAELNETVKDKRT